MVTLTEIAARIHAHLKRIEHDPKLNPGYRWEGMKRVPDPMGLRDYYGAGATRSGARVRVRYISYQGASRLSRAEAERYLAWLDAGNVGTHHHIPREWGER